jgi:predicted outer membrane repeat protein
MANFVVTNLNDSGAGSLRDAISQANTSVGVADTIRFADNLSGTITLTSGQLQLTDDVTINGNTMGGAKSEINISGNNASRIFDIVGAGVDVGLSSLTLTNGGTSALAGGAIKAGFGGTQTLTINDTTIASSTAISGGGIHAINTQVSLTNSLIFSNTAATYGGGIYVDGGRLTMTNATIANNSANDDGGGIDINGIMDVVITNSTIIQNRANADGIGTPFSGGGLDIFTAGANVTLTNTVVADNFIGTGSAESDVFGTVDTADNSLFGTTTTIAGGLFSIVTPAPLGLGPFANHGGSTNTFEIISPTSVLINAGFNLVGLDRATDANGVARIDGGRVDIGATEYTEANIVVTTLTDIVNAGDGVVSLREAVALAATNASPSHIVFDASLSGTINLTSKLILTNNVSINGDNTGDGMADITLAHTGNWHEALIDVAALSTVQLTSLNFAGNSAVPGVNFVYSVASVIRNAGNLTLSYSTFSGNSSQGSSGNFGLTNGGNAATISNYGTMVVNQTLFANNSATGGLGSNGNGDVGYGGGSASSSILNGFGARLTLTGLGLIGGTATGGAGGRGGATEIVADPNFRGGDGGFAALGVLNFGTYGGSFGQGIVGTATGGQGGLGGTGIINTTQGPSGATQVGDTDNQHVFGTASGMTTQVIGTDAGNSLVGVFDHKAVFGLGGSDVITGTGKCYLFGGSGNDFLTSQSDSRVYGGLGNDTLTNSSLGVVNSISGLWDGGAGIDTFNASSSTSSFGLYIDLSTGITNVSGTVRNIENIIGTNNAGLNDRLVGDAGANQIAGKAGTNIISGGGGDDYITGGVGTDIIDGGADRDTVDYSTSTSGVTINLLAHTQSGGDAANDTLTRIENIVGSTTGGDFLIGDDSNNAFYGLGGDDQLTGGGGADQLIGGSGFDIARYDSSTIGLVVSLTTPANNTGQAIGDSFDSIEGLVGTNQIDTLTGNAVTNTLYGLNGADTLFGLGGADTLYGGDGIDVFYGGTGADAMYGGTGNDLYEVDNIGDTVIEVAGAANGIADNVYAYVDFTLGVGVDNLIMLYGNQRSGTGNSADNIIYGNSQLNVLQGGGGYDTLIGGAGSDYYIVNAGFGVDVITDFTAGAGTQDAIVFSKSLFTTFAGVISHAAQVGADTWIGDGFGNTVVLSNVLKTSLHADDFQFA